MLICTCAASVFAFVPDGTSWHAVSRLNTTGVDTQAYKFVNNANSKLLLSVAAVALSV